jgi:DNA (cytosine-5)-methyltransferase 1
MHRAGYRTIAACEVIDWRRTLYSENNPGVPVYDDVTTLTADRLIRDGIGLPDIVVGSPPCQDISSANTKGKGVDGERSGLYFEAIRLIDECRPRWFALENSANLRTRGADRVIDALEAIGYTCWPFVVSAGDIGANHERKRSWLIGFDGNADCKSGSAWLGAAADEGAHDECGRRLRGNARHSDQDIEAPVGGVHGWSVANNGGGAAGPGVGEMGGSASASSHIAEPWADWNGGLAGHLRVDDGISGWVAGTRIAVGGPKGTSAASLIVEAFGDAVCPQIPEAIGRAILRVERALAAIHGDNDNYQLASSARSVSHA